MTTGIDLYQRHGAILAVAEITHALAKISVENNKYVVKYIVCTTILIEI